MITDHVFRPPWSTPENATTPAAERPCRYLSCGRPNSEHERSTRDGAAVTGWGRYRKCSKCGAALGQPCRELTGFNANTGSPGGVVAEIETPHGGRKLRAASTRKGES